MFRQYAFYIIGILLVVGLVGFFFWSLGRAIFSLFEDWEESKELDDLEAEGKQRRAELADTNAQRLDNGCDHHFDTAYGVFPAGVCHKCGLAEQRPPSGCDHVWRRMEDSKPGCRCEKCGKTFNASSVGSPM